ncbi:MAG TPA: DUF6226 family protein [Acidimicrobiales bacterium]|nr:MAG: hypothetical protein B7Z69_06905 [Actinobacteria bacterium 21-73-9]HQU26287.1 DUF6226 family protein [Acidimicrobiales bacterium]
MGHDGAPPPEAYETVTDPERFAVVVERAAGLVARLERDYRVARGPVGPDDLGPGLTASALWVIRLVPDEPRAAPLTLAATPFPGVSALFGRTCLISYPSCGCDACAEDPARLTEELEADVADLVEGRFSEAVSREATRHAFVGPTRSRRGSQTRARGDGVVEAEFDYRPWTPRRAP